VIGSFLLRFQEDCEAPAPGIACGTQTQTRQQAEGSDPDAPPWGLAVVPRGHASEVIPVGSTRTATAVKYEGDDNDPKAGELRTLPRCS
jgi:hypothetical protein